MATEYRMPRRADRCTGCARPFAAGDAIRAYLYETSQGYERRDCCDGCPEPDVSGLLGMWRSRRRERAQRRAAAFDPEVVLAFFRRLDSAAEAPAPNAGADRSQFRFVLALLLWRKKVLRLITVDQDEGGAEAWRFALARDGDEIYTVRRPELPEAELENLSLQLEALLAGDPEDVLECRHEGREQTADAGQTEDAPGERPQAAPAGAVE